MGRNLAHEGLENRVAALVALFFEPLENLLGRIGVLCQQADNLALKRIELAGALGDRRPFETLPPSPSAHGVEPQLEFPGNLPQSQLLFGEQVPNLAIGLVVNHSRPPIAWRNSSPTLIGPERGAPTGSRLSTW